MDTITKILKEKGQRFTSQKKEVFCILKHKPQTVLEILNSLTAKNYLMDKTTIYRILMSFEELGLVREVNLGDREIRYELANNEHHHHLVCEKCRSIEDVELNEAELLREVKNQSSFKIKSHSLEFFGICKKCQ